MCGIAGILSASGGSAPDVETLKGMAAIMRHRGPDGYGIYRDGKVGLAHARLSILDLDGGWQPIHNENENLWIVFNGEIFNHVELRRELEAAGHRFTTCSDTEVIIHLYEEHGTSCLGRLNGQFALAVWDRAGESLFLARDRVGIRPLFYTVCDGDLLFASEMKALFMDRRVNRRLDPVSLDQIFTFWTTVPPRTPFEGVFELPAGHFMTVGRGGRRIAKYWDPDFSPPEISRAEDDYAEELRELLIDATRLRLRADVPVGAYLSGGIDSSAITALIANYTRTPLRTFSVSFEDEQFDESRYQKEVIGHLGTRHSSVHCTSEDVGRVFPDVVWHAETPMLRTAPGPLQLLSGLVHAEGYKVVLTGEGADEVLAGYDIFKEVKIRSFMRKFPESKFRPLILKRLYPYLRVSPTRALNYAEDFFLGGSGHFPEKYGSHAPRWNTTMKTRGFFSDFLKEKIGDPDYEELLEEGLKGMPMGPDELSRAQYIEIKSLLSGYLLSSQGDRMAMAHSVEGRYPFLDHRFMEFCFSLPPNLRMKGLTEKYLLKKSMRRILPESISARNKQPYRSPDAKSLVSGKRPEYVEELLTEENLTRSGYFNPKAVGMLVKKCERNRQLGFKDNMALVGVISTLLLHRQFVERFPSMVRSRSGTMREEECRVFRI